MLSAALSGDLSKVEYSTDPIFGFEVPDNCPGVPDEVLNPGSSWPSESDYQLRYHDLAARFIDNFRKFEDETELAIREAGPTL
jgi:phosphoenolpyruvate carboxykinase (ATP)